MTTKYYNCEFKSDIVLPASSNTQGNIALSDFIPGSNFLGMVASNGSYESFGDESFEVFHSGAVCFGDAHLSVDDKLSYKIPLSFHSLKVGDKNFNRLHLSEDEEHALRAEEKQLKQIRDGFLNEDLKYQIPSYRYSQKSSYNRETRRSKDSGMFGYSALKSGTNWIFKIDYKDEKYISKIENNLLGYKKLGKSKSSQYGQVKITTIETQKQIESFKPSNDLTYIYVNSRLALFEEDGTFTTTPTIENLGLNSGKIVWDKTYIKTSSYTPFNYVRQTKDYTRACINKGSIITIENCTDNIPSKIGAFLSEGFGELLINPIFLEPKNPDIDRLEEKTETLNSADYDKNLIDFLQTKQSNENAKFEVASDVQLIYRKLIGPSKSQWGQIRAFATSSKDKDELISKIDEYISKGVAKKQWEDKKTKLINAIQNHSHPLAFTKLLAMIVSKHTKGAVDAK